MFFVCFFVLSIHSEYFSIQDGQSIKKNGMFIGKIIEKSEHWTLSKGGGYYPATSGSMLQIKAPGVVVDFGNYAVENKDDTGRLVTGVEVGYSGAELEENSDLQQVSNVTIKNGCFINFDVGIIVHRGVNQITIENCCFDGVSLGVVFLGVGGNKYDSTIRIVVKNCTIIGHGSDKQEKLVAFKQKIEGLSYKDGEYGYGADVFMPLVTQGSYADMYTYAGIVANYVYNLNIDNVHIQNIRYHDYANTSEGEGRYTAAKGIFCRHYAGVTIKDSTVYSCASEVSAVGIEVDSARNVHIENTDCTYQKSASCSCGIKVVDDRSYADKFFLRERTVTLKKVTCELNSVQENEFVVDSPEVTTGLSVDGLYSIYADNLHCIGNTGKKLSYGMHVKNIVNSLFEHSSFNNNKSSRNISDVGLEFGIAAFGCYVEESESLKFKSCDFSHNFGSNAGIGCYILQGKSVEFDDCTFTGNKGVECKQHELGSTNVVGSIRHLQDHQEISNYAPIVSAANTGGYGLIADDCQRLGLFRSLSKNNVGHRAVGFLCKNCNVVTIDDVASLYQHGYGDFIHSDIACENQGGVVSNTHDIDIVDTHRRLLFDHIFSEKFTDTSLNIEDYAYSFLTAVATVRTGWESGKFISLTTERAIVKTLSLLFSLMSRFRLWGVAFGMHMHNCSAVLVKNCQFSGQISERDSGAGFVVTGESSSFYIEDSEMSYNVGWRDSTKLDMSLVSPYSSKYDLSVIKPFWDMLFTKFDQVEDTTTAGFFAEGKQLIAQGQKDFDGSGNDITVTVNNTERTFVNIVAPVSAGLILADYYYSGTISNNKFHANKGNAGYCAGLMFHMGESFLVQDNLFDDNSANIYGHCCGLIDMNLYSENNYLRNRLSVNSVDGFYNSHSLIVSTSRSNLSMVYPMAKFNDGVITSKVSEIDNIEINLPSVSAQKKKNTKKKDD